MSSYIDKENIQDLNKYLIDKRAGCLFHENSQVLIRKCWSGQNKSCFPEKLLRTLVKNTKLSSILGVA